LDLYLLIIKIKDINKMATDFFTGFGHAFLGLFGLGEYVDPLGDLTTEISTAQANLTQTIATGTIGAFQAQEKVNQDLLDFINQTSANLAETTNYYNTILTDKSIVQNYFLVVTLMLVFMLIIFIITGNNKK
jgi:hypothetical protein